MDRRDAHGVPPATSRETPDEHGHPEAKRHHLQHRQLGPKGAPGMPEMLGATMALKMMGLKKAALITDGRFSGATSGPCVGHVCPEASDGGPIALIEDGDLVEIDIPNRKLTLHVDDLALARHKAAWQPFEREVLHGFMRRYRKHVRPACEGAILD